MRKGRRNRGFGKIRRGPRRRVPMRGKVEREGGLERLRSREL